MGSGGLVRQYPVRARSGNKLALTTMLPVIPLVPPPAQPGRRHLAKFPVTGRGNGVRPCEGMQRAEPVIRFPFQLAQQQGNHFGPQADDLLIGRMLSQPGARREGTTLPLPEGYGREVTLTAGRLEGLRRFRSKSRTVPTGTSRRVTHQCGPLSCTRVKISSSLARHAPSF